MSDSAGLCTNAKMGFIFSVFLISRVASLLGHLLNRRTGSISFTTFGYSLSIMSLVLSVGLALGFDSFLLL